MKTSTLIRLTTAAVGLTLSLGMAGPALADSPMPGPIIVTPTEDPDPEPNDKIAQPTDEPDPDPVDDKIAQPTEEPDPDPIDDLEQPTDDTDPTPGPGDLKAPPPADEDEGEGEEPVNGGDSNEDAPPPGEAPGDTTVGPTEDAGKPLVGAGPEQPALDVGVVTEADGSMDTMLVTGLVLLALVLLALAFVTARRLTNR